MNRWQKKWGWIFDKRPNISIKNEREADLYFPSKDVLFSESDKAKRGRELLFISRPSFKKIDLRLKISFEDIEGPKSIIFSNWKISETGIKNNNGVNIPIHRINKLKLLNRPN